MPYGLDAAEVKKRRYSLQGLYNRCSVDERYTAT